MFLRIRQFVFVILSLAFFVGPWLIPAVRNYAPGLAVISGIIFAVTLGNPFAEFTGKLSSQLLGAAIVGMGCGMNLLEVLDAGAQGFVYTFIGIVLGLGLGSLLGRFLRIDKNCAWLVSVGTSICGGSAIAAAAPALKAKAGDIALASATVFTLNAVALLIFPWLGKVLGFSQEQFGCFAALAIHDTSSVVGAAYQYGERALEVGTTIKLARALWIVPVTLFVATFVAGKNPGEKRTFKLKVPWFIPGFLIAAAIVTYLPQTAAVGSLFKEISKYLMVFTLFMIGANLSREKLRELGIRPLIHGLVLWILLSAVWCTAIYCKWVQV